MQTLCTDKSLRRWLQGSVNKPVDTQRLQAQVPTTPCWRPRPNLLWRCNVTTCKPYLPAQGSCL